MIIPKPILIAGGLGIAGGAAWFLFKGKGDKAKTEEQVPSDPTMSSVETPNVNAANSGQGPSAVTEDPSGMPSSPTSSSQLQAQQIGPYTVIPDPQSGQMIVFETATKQPVGVVDSQGNLIPINGSNTPSAPSSPAIPSYATTSPTMSPLNQGSGGLSQARDGQQTQYAMLARDLFASAGNAGMSSTMSSPMGTMGTGMSPYASTTTMSSPMETMGTGMSPYASTTTMSSPMEVPANDPQLGQMNLTSSSMSPQMTRVN